MAIQGPIILIEDDQNDAEVIAAAIKELGITNEVKVEANAQEAFTYLCTTTEQPFLIMCDIRMPGMDGLSFRKAIVADDYLRKKSIPFIFFTGLASQDIVNEAYELGVQGFFQKATGYGKMKEQLLCIFMYWRQCLHPNRPVGPTK